jgi:hypothetical protein
MSDTYDWTQRVDQMTGATVHEQLRTVVRDAEEMFQKFSASASETGGLLLDAQREMEATVERKIEQVSSEIAGSLDAVRQDIASIEHAPSDGTIDLEALRKDMEQISVRIGSIEDAQKALQSRIESMLLSTDERFATILAQLQRAAGAEERAAARMADLLATAFAELRKPPSAVNAS